jgi:hypothetical protein
LLAGALAWVLRWRFHAPTQPLVARPPATAVIAKDEPQELAGRTTPTADEQVATPPSTTIAPQVAARPTPLGVDLLVQRWLARYCKGIEDGYEQQGRDQWRCSWQDVQISGSLPTVEVAFTRIDRTVGAGGGAAMELLARERFRLGCADDACRRLDSLPATKRKSPPRRTATPTEPLPHDAARADRQNHPPVVEILTAPQRVVPGERVGLTARVTDPDSSSGDEIECAWSVDGKAMARLCWEFVWTVPATKSYGNVIFTLNARDRQGASDSKSVSVFVGPGK